MNTFIKLAVVVAIVFGGYTVWHKKHMARSQPFEVHGDEVYDPVSDLTWKRCSVGMKWTGTTCEGHLPGFRFDAAQQQGDDKWRVPTEKELVTLIDQPRASKGLSPAIDQEVFPNFGRGDVPYWTSSRSSGVSCWYVRFSTGSAGIGSDPGPYRQAEFNEYSVTLVRSGR